MQDQPAAIPERPPCAPAMGRAPGLLRLSQRFWAAAAIASLVLSACAWDTAGDAAAARPVADGSWELVQSSFVGAGRIPGMPRPTLSFKDGSLEAFGGCSRVHGTGHTRAGRLEVSELAGARRPCPEPLATLEERYFKLLRLGPSLHIEGDTLILSGSEHNARFRRAIVRPAQPAP